MPITIEQVTHWTRPYRGVGCVVVQTHGGWVFTACRSLRTGDAVKTRPPRVCRKCRAGLKDLTPAGGGSTGEGR
jgi:hypothetical protein